MEKQVFISLLYLFSLGILPSASQSNKAKYPWDNGKLIVSDNKKYLQHENGTPFFWLGETAWLLPSRSNRDEVDFFMNEKQKDEYNVVQVSVLHDIPAMNSYGHFALPYGFDFSNIDKPGIYNYWQHIDYIVETARQRGIYIAIVCV